MGTSGDRAGTRRLGQPWPQHPIASCSRSRSCSSQTSRMPPSADYVRVQIVTTVLVAAHISVSSAGPPGEGGSGEPTLDADLPAVREAGRGGAGAVAVGAAGVVLPAALPADPGTAGHGQKGGRAGGAPHGQRGGA